MMPLPRKRASRSARSGCRRALAAANAAAMAVSLAACALGEHSIEPYRGTPAEAERLEQMADAACLAMRARVGRSGLPERGFRTDGCSAFPDTEATQCCCIEHDIAYWCGGSQSQRLEADDAFGACVAERTGSSIWGATMRAGVRLGGHPVFPTWYRWGYGDPHMWGYPESTRPPTDAARRPEVPSDVGAAVISVCEDDRRGATSMALRRSADPSGCP